MYSNPKYTQESVQQFENVLRSVYTNSKMFLGVCIPIPKCS